MSAFVTNGAFGLLVTHVDHLYVHWYCLKQRVSLPGCQASQLAGVMQVEKQMNKKQTKNKTKHVTLQAVCCTASVVERCCGWKGESARE